MWYMFFGLSIGILIGLNLPWSIPEIFARYLAIACLAAIDTSLGGLRSSLEGGFDIAIFVSGFLGNVLISAVLVYIGDALGIELYLAAVVALGIRIFNNLGAIRRYYVARLLSKKSL